MIIRQGCLFLNKGDEFQSPTNCIQNCVYRYIIVKVMKPLLLGPCLLMIVSCSKEDRMSRRLSIIGNWAFAYNCPHNAYCVGLEEFEASQSKITVTFISDSTYTAKVSDLNVKGSYQITIDDSEKFNKRGLFSLQTFEVLNKPSQTLEDTYFIEYFKKSMSYSLSNYNSKKINLSICNEFGCSILIKTK